MQIQGTAAIVTGGASGLGAATAKALAAKGARVFAVDLEASIAKAEPSDGVTFVTADVTDADQVQRAVDTGPPTPARPCASSSTARASPRRPASLSKKGPHDLDLFRKVIEVNLSAPSTS